MKICSVCQRCYENETVNCVENHGILIAEPQISREMIKNFRLDLLLERDVVGESFMATHTVHDKRYVIKILNQNSITNAGEIACRQLGYEAQAAVELKHPNIAHLYEFGALDNGGFYTATEFSGGRSLQEALRNEGSLSETDAVTIAEQVAEALIAAHDAGIVHRAISPANVILSRGEDEEISIKLQNFDFGGIREKTITADENDDAAVEMLRYLSPEQCDGRTSDEKTDVYSLGIVLYEMLCGRSPFAAPTSAAISERKINEKPLSELRLETRALFSNTVKDALRRRTAARLQSDQFARQLRHIAQVIFRLGDPFSEKSRLSLPPVLSVNLDEFDSSNVFNSAPNLESFEFQTGDRTLIGTDASVEIETAPINSANPIFEQSPEIKVEKSAPENSAGNSTDKLSTIIDETQISASMKKPEIDLSESASVSADEQTSEPILNEKKYVDEDLYKTGSLNNENPPEIEKLQFDDNEYTFGTLNPIFVERKQSFENSSDEDDSEPITLIRENPNAVPLAPKIFDAAHENVEPVRKTATVAPNFGNYSGKNPPRRRALPANRSTLVGIGLLSLLIVSLVLGAFLYNRNQQEQPVISETSPPASSAPQDSTIVSETKNKTAESNQPAAPETITSAPNISEKTDVTTPDRRAGQTPPAESAKKNAPNREQVASVEPPIRADGKPQAELNTALNKLISATNSGDVEQQMNYYAPKLDAYYLSRNASQNAVRAEKKRIFSRADEIDIQAGNPDIKLSPDGRKATMRFRKKYAIKQGQKNRRGEVVQELQWVKSGDGWRIVSERDVKVINR